MGVCYKAWRVKNRWAVPQSRLYVRLCKRKTDSGKPLKIRFERRSSQRELSSVIPFILRECLLSVSNDFFLTCLILTDPRK